MKRTEEHRREGMLLVQSPVAFAGDGDRDGEGLRRRRVGGNNIFVRRSAGEAITLECEGLETVADVKAKIYEKECIHPTQQRLMFGRRLLYNHRTLAHYKIQKGSTIHLLKNDLLGDGKGMNSIHGWPLDDSNTLADYGIKENSSGLHLAPGRHGGGGPPKVGIIAAHHRLQGNNRPESTLHSALGPSGVGDQPEMEITTHPDGLRRRRHASEDKIYIRTQTGRTLEFKLDLSKTIADVKDMIQDKVGLHPDQQRILFNGKQLVTHCTLADYNIQNGTTIYVLVYLVGGGGQHFFVQKLTGESFELRVPFTETVSKIRDMIYEKEGIHRTQQQLVLDGLPLDDDRTLKDYNIHSGSTLHLALVRIGADTSLEDEVYELVQTEQPWARDHGHDQLSSGASWAPVTADEAIGEQEGVIGETEEQPSEVNVVHGIGTLADQLVQKRKRWYKYSLKNLVFAISILATYLGSASTSSSSTGKVALKIAIGSAFVADAALSILMPPKWGDALVYLSWLLVVLVSYLLLVSFNKDYGYAILPLPLPIVVALLQPKLKLLGVMQQRRPDPERANNQDHEDTNNDDEDDGQHFDLIFDLSGDIVNCGGIITVIFGHSMVGPAIALGFLFFYTVALGLYLMMVTTVRAVALTPHARFLAILLKVLLVITLITSLIHGVSSSNGSNVYIAP